MESTGYSSCCEAFFLFSAWSQSGIGSGLVGQSGLCRSVSKPEPKFCRVWAKLDRSGACCSSDWPCAACQMRLTVCPCTCAIVLRLQCCHTLKPVGQWNRAGTLKGKRSAAMTFAVAHQVIASPRSPNVGEARMAGIILAHCVSWL